MGKLEAAKNGITLINKYNPLLLKRITKRLSRSGEEICTKVSNEFTTNFIAETGSSANKQGCIFWWAEWNWIKIQLSVSADDTVISLVKLKKLETRYKFCLQPDDTYKTSYIIKYEE